MTWGNMGSLKALPGKRDELVAILTRFKPELASSGCLVYEVGTNPGEPDLVFVLEVWDRAESHREALGKGSVREAVQEALPLMEGELVSMRFDVAGSPLTR
ncbi:MAG: putative quinol monooxygenase [Amnibacterium sp.]